MKLGILTASMSRQAGGLFWAIKSLAERVRDAGCDLQIFAGEDECSEKDREEWGNIPLNVFPQRGPTAFGYQVGLSKALADAALDLIHIHGLWMYPSVAAKNWARSGKPYLITPHGMLDPWAVRNAAWKKRLAGLLYENAHLRGAACLHALCESERKAIRTYGLRNSVAVIPNGVVLPAIGVDAPAPEWGAALPPGAKVLFFLSRLHPKKGLVNLLHAWANTKKTGLVEAEPWQLVIAGWDQGGHQTELENLARELEIASTVHFVGPQFDQSKSASFRRADAFILPSFSEGLPMAVLEAWSYKLPVLMTPQCNIPEGFENNAAIEIQADPKSIVNGLNSLFILSDIERKNLGNNGFSLVSKKFAWEKVAEEMYSVYLWLLGKGVAPACVVND